MFGFTAQISRSDHLLSVVHLSSIHQYLTSVFLLTVHIIHVAYIIKTCFKEPWSYEVQDDEMKGYYLFEGGTTK